MIVRNIGRWMETLCWKYDKVSHLIGCGGSSSVSCLISVLFQSLSIATLQRSQRMRSAKCTACVAAPTTALKCFRHAKIPKLDVLTFSLAPKPYDPT